MPSPSAKASATFTQTSFDPGPLGDRAGANRGGGAAGAASAGVGETGATATRGSLWHLGHRSVPSGRLAQQDRQNIGRDCGAGLS